MEKKSKAISNILNFLQQEYKIKIAKTKSNFDYWQKYLDYPPNPKYFKVGVTAKDSSGKKIFFASNLPKKLVLPLIKRKIKDTGRIQKITGKLYKKVLNRLKQQAYLSLFLKTKRAKINTAKTLLVLVDKKEYKSASLLIKALQNKKRAQIAIRYEHLPLKNLYEYFTESDYLSKSAFQKKGAPFANLLLNITALKLNKTSSLPKDYLKALIKKAQNNISELEENLKLPNFFPLARSFLSNINTEKLKENRTATIYADSTPVNFLFDKDKFYTIDIESLSTFYASHAISHNLVYFLIHFPFKKTREFRFILLKSWLGGLRKRLAAKEDLVLTNLILEVLTFSPETLLNSKRKIKNKNLKLTARRLQLHKEIVSYNKNLLSELFPSYETKSLSKTLKIFY